MRLFVGIELDAAVKAAAADAAERLRQRLQQVAPDLHARWVAPGQLHLTVWFIGEVADGRAHAIQEALGPSFETRAFDLEIAGAGCFPPAGRPRVLWLGVRQGGPELAELYQEVGRRLAPLGFEPERRAYTAHLTLARFRETGGSSARAIARVVEPVAANCGGSRIRAVTLFRSRLSPRGAAYEPLLRVPLKQ